MIKTENFTQQEIYIWFNNTFCLTHQPDRMMIFSIPNGGNRDAREGKTLKNTGLLAGASDLIVVLPNKVLFIEVKTSTGIQSTVQKDFENRVLKLNHDYFIVKSLQDFKDIIAKFIPFAH